ncbi:MAG: N-glycosylase/DNA lyase [Candidatus Omnitrophota bacterium]
MVVRQDKIAALRGRYRQQKLAIIERLAYFKETGKGSERDIFGELCFCILTPQAKALVCDGIIRKLKSSGLLFDGDAGQIRPHVKKARFYRNKTGYILAARNQLSVAGKIRIKEKISGISPVAAREWLVNNIKGIGYKEASHFLRNIGLGGDLAILDVHILRNLKDLGVINEIPGSLTRKLYLEIEEKLRVFAGRCRVPIGHLDLLFWSMATGVIFK